MDGLAVDLSMAYFELCGLFYSDALRRYALQAFAYLNTCLKGNIMRNEQIYVICMIFLFFQQIYLFIWRYMSHAVFLSVYIARLTSTADVS
mgnify:FL=1